MNHAQIDLIQSHRNTLIIIPGKVIIICRNLLRATSTKSDSNYGYEGIDLRSEPRTYMLESSSMNCILYLSLFFPTG